ncbi:hypothetical protein KX928_23240 [Roseobacter sp. YSTF-M11]|uniref:Uncharacterized protein n=1 Tax=Roseobacter insulae TaxID=2859783 RepID=A0A9X1K0W8_9RHOB|nr:hypothetical protein [Roseobacter insulae]MBW4710715.1 hypothetical protein [Roseobacter insulae]
MPQLKILPFDGSKPAGSGISISQGEVTAGQFVKISIVADAQLERFGRTLDPDKDTFVLTLCDDKGKSHLLGIKLGTVDDADGLPIKIHARGSAVTQMAPWCHLAPGKRPAKQMPLAHAPRIGEVVLKLPEWARPPIAKIGSGKSIMDM